MLSINGKKFMNLPEAVQWLLDNNALPFQSTASFAPDTEIAKSTIINPAPAEIKIGSLVLFADGKVGTVSAITSNGFKVGQDATDLADGVPHVTDIQINASDHLIITMSEGDSIDAGLIRMVSGFTIDASQHLIVNYNDGTSEDLGAIFNGNVTISGTLTVDTITSSGTTMSALKPIIQPITNIIFSRTPISENVSVSYASAARNGNKLTLVISGTIEKSVAFSSTIGRFLLPASILDKLIPVDASYVCAEQIYLWDDAFTLGMSKPQLVQKGSTAVDIFISQTSTLADNTTYNFRSEFTFLLSDSL